MNELEGAINCLKHEIKKFKERPIETPVLALVTTLEQADHSPLENDFLCLKYKVKRLKERTVAENLALTPC